MVSLPRRESSAGAVVATVWLLFSGRLRRGRGVRAQIARDLRGDERDEDSQRKCSEDDRTKARSDEGEPHEQAHDA